MSDAMEREFCTPISDASARYERWVEARNELKRLASVDGLVNYSIETTNDIQTATGMITTKMKIVPFVDMEF